ncbi:MAG: hypothetical protein EAY75_14570 [Bacteroidetes bacterium]|nr:MAG: hypothetical protein EAY75_14570 [Bacteroidota bacterium]
MKIPYLRILVTIGLFFFVFVLGPEAFSDESRFVVLLGWALIIYNIVKIIKALGSENVPTKLSPPTTRKLSDAPSSAISSVNGKTVLIVLVAAVIMMFLFVESLAPVALHFFQYGDKLFAASATGPSAVIAWSVLGVLLGLITGTLVAIKKYKLNWQLMFYPVGLLAAVAGIFSFINKPSERLNEIDAATYTPTKKKVSVPRADAYPFVSISASSLAASYKAFSFEPSNLIDGNDNTAWIEGGADEGIGERIVFLFDKGNIDDYSEFECTGYKIKNGVSVSAKSLQEFNRVSSFRIILNAQSIEVSYPNVTGIDPGEWEEISFSRPLKIRSGDRLSFKIENVEYGKNKDKTAVSEIVPIVEYTY